MYRVLDEHTEVRERRDQLRHPAYTKPELLATGPNQVWSWDITRLLGPTKWTYYYLYVMLDIFSRYVVGWLVAERESGTLAELLITDACAKQVIGRDHLMIHADNGGPMIAKPVTLLMTDLGLHPSHSRPHVSKANNPFSRGSLQNDEVSARCIPTALVAWSTPAPGRKPSSRGTTLSTTHSGIRAFHDAGRSGIRARQPASSLIASRP